MEDVKKKVEVTEQVEQHLRGVAKEVVAKVSGKTRSRSWGRVSFKSQHSLQFCNTLSTTSEHLTLCSSSPAKMRRRTSAHKPPKKLTEVCSISKKCKQLTHICNFVSFDVTLTEDQQILKHCRSLNQCGLRNRPCWRSTLLRRTVWLTFPLNVTFSSDERSRRTTKQVSA